MSPELSPWKPLYDGIDHATGTCGTPPDSKPNVNALKIDLTNDRIALRLSAWDDLRPTGLTVREFLDKSFDVDTMEAMVAVNANYFDNDAPYDKRNVAFGLAVSSGRLLTYVYSSNVDAQTPCALLVSESNAALIGKTFDVYDAFALRAQGQRPWTGTSGNYYLVDKGAVDPDLPSAGPKAARTAIGLSIATNEAAPTHLYLLTIDGLEDGSDYGATYREAAEWLIAAGAVEGFNLDGGGSTTMAKIQRPPSTEPIQSSAVLMNVPHDDEQNATMEERPVAVSFGVAVLA